MSPRLFARILGFIALLSAILPLRAAVAHPSAGVSPPIRLRDLGGLVALHGSLLPRLALAHRQAQLPGRTRLEVDVALRVRDESGLKRFLHDVYDPESPVFHHFLTPQQFAARFAPTTQQRRVLTGWLASKGLHVVSQAGNGLLIQARATAKQASNAFGTHIYWYVRGREHFFANATEIRIPRGLSPAIMSVNGLDNAEPMRPAGLHVLGRPQNTAQADFGGFTPNDLRGAYDLTPLYGAGLDGAGQTIAVAEFADFVDSDVAAYDQQFGLNTTTPQRVDVPYSGQHAKTGGDGQGEVELDIEVVHAIAPQARLLVYESPLSKGAGLVQANRIVSDNLAKVVSVSWGYPESYVEPSYVSSYDQISMEGAAQGQAGFVASGDQGAYDAAGWFDAGDPRNNALTIDYPSADPWVTSVGGTALSLSGSGYGSEWVWSDHSDNSGSGGGLSTYFSRPTWQNGPGVANSYSNGMRQTPDVSAVADPSTGYEIYTIARGTTGWHVFGGTSGSSPLWAAFTTLLQQYLKETIGFMNPTLYALGQKAGTFQYAPFHDVTQGDNLYYAATTGWDFATGWGSMDGTALLNDLVTMGGPLITQPAVNTTPPPVVQPTPSSIGAVSYHVVAHWEKAGSKGGISAPPLTTSKKGKKVQLGLYFEVDSGRPNLAVTASFTVIFKGKSVAGSTVSRHLASTNPTGTYSAVKTYTPNKKGVYTFLGKVSMGGEVVARAAALTVK